jgi:hypothetical protein
MTSENEMIGTVRVVTTTLLRHGYPNASKAEERARNIVQALVGGDEDVHDVLDGALNYGTAAEFVSLSAAAFDELFEILTTGRIVALTNNTKRFEDWQSRIANPKSLGLTQFLKPGDYVDEGFYTWMRDAVPPIDGRDTLQMGEPYSSDSEGRSTFATLQRFGRRWVYTGTRIARESVRIAQ